MKNWVNEDLEQEIRKVFEPRYKRRLLSNEIIEIAENLTGSMEAILRFKCENEYGKQSL